MNTVYTFNQNEFQALLNDAKEEIITRINADFECNIRLDEYVYVIRTRGCLGKIFDRLLGRIDNNQAQRVLLHVKLPYGQTTHIQDTTPELEPSKVKKETK